MNGNLHDRENIKAKIDHSLRVSAEAGCIADALGLDPEYRHVAHVAALYHDIGRFPQYARYKTYNDRISTNHARLGVQTLKQARILSELPRSQRFLVLGAIALHNRKFIPNSLSRPIDLQVRILRDADKLDIMNFMLQRLSSNTPHNEVLALGLNPHPERYTQSILDQVRARQPVHYEDLVYINDFKLVFCSWSYDLNFSFSHRLMLERRYVDRIFELLPETPLFSELAATLTAMLAKKASRNQIINGVGVF